MGAVKVVEKGGRENLSRYVLDVRCEPTILTLRTELRLDDCDLVVPGVESRDGDRRAEQRNEGGIVTAVVVGHKWINNLPKFDISCGFVR